MKIYLATNFFSDMGFEWTKKVGYRLRSLGFDVYIPQENGEINDKSNNEVTDVDIANGDNKYLEDANILVACLDGVEIDSGVSAEIGYFSGLIRAEKRLSVCPKSRTIIGIYTDIRQNASGDNRFYINLYTKGLVNLNGKVCSSVNEAMNEAVKFKKRGDIIKC